mgnify:CR=1 FL=1
MGTQPQRVEAAPLRVEATPQRVETKSVAPKILKKPSKRFKIIKESDDDDERLSKVDFHYSVNIYKPTTLHSHTKKPRNGERAPSRKQPRRAATKRINSAIQIQEGMSLRVKEDQMPFAFTAQEIAEATKLAFEADQQEHRPMPKGFAFKAVNVDTGELAEYKTLIHSSKGEKWKGGMCNEFGRLFQGYKDIKGTNTCKFIRKRDIPQGRTATYIRIVVADRPRKTEPERVRMTVGGDRVDYPGEVTTKTTDLATAKILLNSVISTPGARF